MGRYAPENVLAARSAQRTSIFISTGELSGEMHAAHLVRALQALRKEQGLAPAVIEGNGSQRMRDAGVGIVHDVATWSELGIIHNLLKAQFFHKVVSATVRRILARQPGMVILVDSRVLNLNLARMLRSRGYRGRIVYYIAPVRWESLFDPAEHQRSLRNPRFLQVKRYCDFAILAYPVSERVYAELGIPHEFTGHPLCEAARPELTDAEFSRITGIEYTPENPPLIIGAMPGSRVREVQWIAPPIYRALALLAQALSEDPALPRLHAVSPIPHPELAPGMLLAARQAGLSDLVLIDGRYSYDLMVRARLMLVKSGTGLHECMLLGVPAIMCYRVPGYLAWFSRHVLRFSMPYYGLPNLLAGRPVVPELIQEDCTHTKIAEHAGSLLFEKKERESMINAFAELRTLVCRPAPLRRAAELIQQLLDA